MSKLIGAEAAELAGLQGESAQRLAGLCLDQLIKLRAGQMTLDQIERFNNLSPVAREERFGDWKKPTLALALAVRSPGIWDLAGKFTLLEDLGVLTVPRDYIHDGWLASFREHNYRNFLAYNAGITDQNFPKPSHVLSPCERLHVRLWKQTGFGTTTHEDRMEFLRELNSLFVGPQGAALLFARKRQSLPMDYRYEFLDEEKAVYTDGTGQRWLVALEAILNKLNERVFSFELSLLDAPKGEDVVLVSFNPSLAV